METKTILSGTRFGHLTVIAEAPRCGTGQYPGRRFFCRCDCGNRTDVLLGSLTSGKSTSCGCVGAERIGLLNKTHGLTQHPLYRVWSGMKSRCYNENTTHYGRYGGKGISICDAWLNNFEAFYNWAMAAGWYEGCELSVDRIDGAGNYEPSNCRLATATEQSRNREGLKILTYKGVTAPLSVHCERLGLEYSRVKYRLNVAGWSVEKAFETPLQTTKDRYL
jgi:hypothetical protein